MDRRDAVLDASFWINAERSGLALYLLDYFRHSQAGHRMVGKALIAIEILARRKGER